MKGISIIIPTLNEELNISPLISRIVSECEQNSFEYEIIFVDDHSTDLTISKIKEYAKKFPVSVFEKKGKPGKAFSLLEGFAKAKYDILAMIDADLQYPPEAISEMIEKIEKENADFVVAKRNEKNISFLRKILSRGFFFVFAKTLHSLNFDVQSGLKVFRREIFERIHINPTPWTFDMEFLIKSIQAGYKIKEFPIDFERRKGGNPKIHLVKASLEIGLNALKLKIKKPDVIPFHP